MKKKFLKYIIAAVFIGTTFSSCDKFLNVTPIDALSGNNFWKTQKDVEGYTNGIYLKLKNKVGGTMLIPSLDMRGNFVKIVQNLDNNGNDPINNLIANNLRPVKNGSSTYENRLKENMDWKGWYDVIAASNILHYQVGEMSERALSTSLKQRYQAEAVFTRNLAYMFLTKMFGDVIYYTEPYHSKALPRKNQVEVMKACINDMMAVKDNLPVAYNEQSQNGIRPTRASAIALLIHLNMWAAAWDTGDNTQYYEAVTTLDEELTTYSQYRLLPKTTENTKAIFKGRSAENLFTVLQDFNYGETFQPFANYSFFFSHYPYRGASSKQQSHLTYEKKYIDELYPASTPDSRRENWFENIDADNNTFQFKKFANIYSTGSGSSVTMFSDDSAVIFRIADILLLAAEAYAELGMEDEAKENLNKVREAAGAPLITSGGQMLKDEIYKERSRELIGEGHFFFDLVRTKRVIDNKYTKAVMSVGNFNSGAWTWPLIISSEESSANPQLTENPYWN